MSYLPGPDFPTGGMLVDDQAALVEAYKTGRGFFRLRARWHTEETGRGTYQIIVTEIPYGVQKSRLIEKMADLLQAKKLPLLGDVDDESAEDIRIVIEPKSRNVDAALLMEQLFRLTELEARVPLNMTVLSKGQIPQVLGLVASAAGVARPPQSGAAPALRTPAEADRAPARSAGRLADRLSQPR